MGISISFFPTETLSAVILSLVVLRTLGVFTNADTPDDAQVARDNGAEGIGLCRTEHMFFSSEERIKTVRKMIVAQDKEARIKALEELLPFQRSDFEGLFTAMSGLPVTIRLLDPPLHEFLPDGDVEEVVATLAKETGATEQDIMDTVERLEELNPMLGFRGCRLAITYPEIAEMQVRYCSALGRTASGCRSQLLWGQYSSLEAHGGQPWLNFAL